MLIYPPNLLLPSNAKKAILPIGIAYLAAELRAGGAHVDVLDCVIEDINTEYFFNGTEYFGLRLEEIKARIAEGSYDVVGVSCQFSNLVEMSVEVCRVAKEECGVAHVVVGGSHASASPEALLESNIIDYVFIGESEKSILEFSRALDEKNVSSIRKIDGLAYMDNGKVHISPKRSFIENLDEIHFPARDLFPMEKYFTMSSPMGGVYKSKRNTTIITSRGCTAKCSFCATTRFWGTKFRYRSAENVLRELQELKETYGVEEVQFQDDNFTLNKKRALEICQGMRDRKLNLHWSTPQGIALWAIDEEIIDSMSMSGCHYAAAAIESGNQRVLREVINKPLKLDKVPSLCKHFKKRGITLSAFFVVGFPDETLDEIRETFDFASKCNLDLANFVFATPLPGSPLWKQAEEENLFAENFSLKDVRFDVPSLRSKNWEISEFLETVQSCKRKFFIKTFFRNPKVITFRIFRMLTTDYKRLFSLIYNQLFSSLFSKK